MISCLVSPAKPSFWQQWMNVVAATTRVCRSILLYWNFTKHSMLKKLLHKLDNSGMGGPLHSWTESFLCDRHKTVIDGETS